MTEDEELHEVVEKECRRLVGFWLEKGIIRPDDPELPQITGWVKDALYRHLNKTGQRKDESEA